MEPRPAGAWLERLDPALRAVLVETADRIRDLERRVRMAAVERGEAFPAVPEVERMVMVGAAACPAGTFPLENLEDPSTGLFLPDGRACEYMDPFDFAQHENRGFYEFAPDEPGRRRVLLGDPDADLRVQDLAARMDHALDFELPAAGPETSGVRALMRELHTGRGPLPAMRVAGLEVGRAPDYLGEDLVARLGMD